jgi:acetyl-CoA carboxylase biotin carboxyl carrier protein
MNQRELKELIEFLIEKDIAEFELERGDVKVRIKRGVPEAPAGGTERIIAVHPAPIATAMPVPPMAAGQAPAPPAAPPAVAQDKGEEGLHIVHSPIVGTYYESPSPGSPPFVKVGDTVEAGQVLCIVEAMKLMNEIEADMAGEIVKMFVKNGAPIEYGHDLFAIRPKR